MKYFFILLTLMACSGMELEVNGSPSDQVTLVRHEKYTELKGAGDILRKVSGATLMITFRHGGDVSEVQDLIALSVGGKMKRTHLSRASLRLDKGGHLMGIARADDSEESQSIRSKIIVSPHELHVASLVIDYESNEMKLYLDGEQLESEGIVLFKSRKTSDTPSLSASLGAEDDGSAFFFKGELKNPMIWSRKLGPDVIKLYSKK